MQEYYASLEKTVIFQAPNMYAWNILLRCKQFTQAELLQVREYLPLPEMIRFQTSATMEFLRTHFAEEIDACLEVDWEDCARLCACRVSIPNAVPGSELASPELGNL